jgi:hypothetical protein
MGNCLCLVGSTKAGPRDYLMDSMIRPLYGDRLSHGLSLMPPPYIQLPPMAIGGTTAQGIPCHKPLVQMPIENYYPPTAIKVLKDHQA